MAGALKGRLDNDMRIGSEAGEEEIGWSIDLCFTVGFGILRGILVPGQFDRFVCQWDSEVYGKMQGECKYDANWQAVVV